MESGACWICGGARFEPLHANRFDLAIYRDQDPALAAYSGRTVTLERCARCGFAQPDRLPALEGYFERMYDQRWPPGWLADEFLSDAKTAIFSGILDGLERRVAPGSRRLLDVGAHVGRFIAIASSRGWAAEGLELNPTTAAYARARTGLTVHGCPLSEMPGDRYDAVTLIDVLEHIPRPVSALASAASALVPGGWIAVKVPCGPNQLLKERLRAALGRASRVSVADNLVHVSHFSARSLAIALERTGFSSVRIGVGAPERVVTRPRLRRAASNAIRRAVHASAGVFGPKAPVAFNLQAYARKRPF